MKGFYRTGLVSAIILFFITGSAVLTAQTAPAWVANLEGAYPDKDFVRVSASGANQSAAEGAAKNALAQAFKTDVASLTKSSQAFTQVLSETAGKKSVSFDYSQTLVDDLTTSTNVQGLIGVQIETFQAKDGTWYVSARMNRRECGQRYEAMIRENSRIISRLLALAKSLPATFDAYAALNYAYNIAVPTDNFQLIWEVLDARAVSQKPAYSSADAVKVLLQDAARTIVIAVTVEGDTGGRVMRSFTQFFSGKGFRTTRTAASAVYSFIADLTLEKADFGANQRNQNVRYVLNVYAEDKDGIEVFSYSGGDRASHASESEARQLALRKVEASIGDGKNKEDFAAGFNAYLSSLLK
jgi:hypothetical protein